MNLRRWGKDEPKTKLKYNQNNQTKTKHMSRTRPRSQVGNIEAPSQNPTLIHDTIVY